ncbi:MAG: DNA alkylation repair protein [Candidatus Marinimicrobia bacterium]|nr:DNA alkylation repair protein [Candidatus Neomarinimicrobiota bacterium]
MKTAEQIINELMGISNKKIAEHSQKFFKTGKGEYGEGDIFLGIRVPELRKISQKYQSLPLNSLESLITSPYHEVRLLALYLLVLKYKKAQTEEQQKEICDFYLTHSTGVNNWDLVDASAHYILGPFLMNKDRSLLWEMARSNDLWQKRISIMSTFHFIKNLQFNDTLRIAEILLHDTHDLIHKAVGWMLREIGNRDKAVEEVFLLKHYRSMPRTMLRYAIEKFPPAERRNYLEGKV